MDIGQNIKAEVKGKKLVIEVDLDRDLGPSRSGKTILIATSAGNVRITGTDAFIGLNVYKHKV